MKKKILLWIFIGITALVLLIIILMKVVVEPWIGKKIQTTINEKSDDYELEIESVNVSILRSGIEFHNITLLSKNESAGKPELTGEIESVKIKGIHLIKAAFSKDIDIREVEIFNSRINGMITFPEKNRPAKLSPLNIRIENLILDRLVVDIKSKTTPQSYSIEDGVIKLYEINIEKQDTLSPEIIGQFDIDASEFETVTPDSLYTFLVTGIKYSATSNTLTVDSFAFQPNYSEYEFTALSTFETNHIEGYISHISFFDFSATDFVKSRNLASSFIEIGDFQLNVFRDKRKEFPHTVKPTFQEMIYSYPGILNIDSLDILSGNIVYTLHGEKAVEKGSLSFTEVDATLYKITNDTIYKTEKGYLELKVTAFLMGTGNVDITLKSRIYDSQNTFAVNGRLSAMDASDINPFLEKTAMVTITSGKINSMDFSISANNTKATGDLKLLYEDLKFAMMNKETGETNAIIDQAKSLIANMIVIESNPMPGKEVRIGTIDHERDPERFLFRYVAMALLSGIKPTLIERKL